MGTYLKAVFFNSKYSVNILCQSMTSIYRRQCGEQ